LVHRYWQLGHVCMVAVGAAYVGGIVQAKRLQAALAAEVQPE
jgi:hypothetical protein